MLETANASVVVRGSALLSCLSLSLLPGTMSAILGPNGAGKSTLLSLLAGERHAATGSVSLDGRPLLSWSPRNLAQRRAVMHQSAPLGFPFTVEEVVALGFAAAAPGTRRSTLLDRSLGDAGVAHLRGRVYTSLSGGERQRVQFARTLAQALAGDAARPGYLLLDEPTANLDPRHQHHLLHVARTWCRETGGSVIVVLHDLTLAAAYADEVLLLAEGRLAWRGTPALLPTQLLERVFGIPFHRVRLPQDEACAFVAQPHETAIAPVPRNDNDHHSHFSTPYHSLTTTPGEGHANPRR